MKQTPLLPFQALVRRLPFVAIVIVALIGGYFLRDYFSFAVLRENRADLLAFRDTHYLTSAAIFIVIYILIVAFSLPGATIATLTGGFLFGAVFGTVFNVLAASIGASAIFLAARSGFGRPLRARIDASQGRISRIAQRLDENQWSMLLFIRLVPVVPFFIANLLPAVMDVPIHRYIVSTILGILPGAIVYTSVGAGLGSVFARGGTPDLGIIFTPEILLPILGLAFLSLIPVAIKACSNRKTSSNDVY